MSQPNAPESETVKVHGTEGLLSIIPSYLGFHPADSVVVVGVQPGGVIQPVARIDTGRYLTDPAGSAQGLAEAIGRHVSRAHIVFYGLARDEHDLAARLAGHGIEIIDVVFAGNDRVNVNAQIHAADVLRGRVIRRNREELRATVEFAGTDTPHDAAIVAAMTTVDGRDAVLVRLMGDFRESLPALTAACRAVPDGRDEGTEAQAQRAVVANLLSTTAMVAYRCGDGALAQLAIDRALRADPDHRLTHLLLAMIAAGMPPGDLDSIADITVDARARTGT